ncbi:hypothetical protein F5B22DRAFT_445648 [Xylaria bambusicola]|uniref:uncharacterized protein n=1 Tax=Xylaria bambusicola TaxID=326684 RepID=UPI002008B080|nr:uncharacterized protein F5B22DRAFT_445648 [Xylaria bambusicola]KAI0506525.1 hypothetical protein F5B22DRAFT_445648 [Xylaria bambusicola]
MGCRLSRAVMLLRLDVAPGREGRMEEGEGEGEEGRGGERKQSGRREGGKMRPAQKYKSASASQHQQCYKREAVRSPELPFDEVQWGSMGDGGRGNNQRGAWKSTGRHGSHGSHVKYLAKPQAKKQIRQSRQDNAGETGEQDGQTSTTEAGVCAPQHRRTGNGEPVTGSGRCGRHGSMNNEKDSIVGMDGMEWNGKKVINLQALTMDVMTTARPARGIMQGRADSCSRYVPRPWPVSRSNSMPVIDGRWCCNRYLCLSIGVFKLLERGLVVVRGACLLRPSPLRRCSLDVSCIAVVRKSCLALCHVATV